MDPYMAGAADLGGQDDFDGNGRDTGGSADPSGKRRRVQRACDACRRKKVRCEGGSKENPCALCRHTNTACTFQEMAKKRGPPKGYVEALERRLATMENLLQSLSPGIKLNASPPTSNEADSSPETGDPSPSSGHLPGSAADDVYGECGHAMVYDTDDEDFLEQFGSLHVEDARYVGKSSGLGLARTLSAFRKNIFPSDGYNLGRLRAETSRGYPMRPYTETRVQQEHLRLANVANDLAHPELADSLVELYFENINSWFPILHKPTFLRERASGMGSRVPSFHALECAVCALGARFTDDPRVFPTIPPGEAGLHGKQAAGSTFFLGAMRSATPWVMAATLYDLQTLPLTVLYLCGAATPIAAWAGIGHAIRRAQDVGAHRRVSVKWNADPLQDELRKRAWFAMIILDRELSSGLGRPLAVSEDDFDLDRPLELNDADLVSYAAAALKRKSEKGKDDQAVPLTTKSQGPTAIAGFNCMIRLSQIYARALKTIYSIHRGSAADGDGLGQWEQRMVAELDSALNKWLDEVPNHLRWSSQQESQWTPQSGVIYSSYYCLQILVHRDFLTPERQGLLNFPSLAICQNAARSCSHVLDALRRRNMIERTFLHSGTNAITAGMILLVSLYGAGQKVGEISRPAMADVEKCIKVLGALSERTWIANKCSVSFSRLVEVSVHGENGPNDPPSSLKRRQRDEDGEVTRQPADSSDGGDYTGRPPASAGFPSQTFSGSSSGSDFRMPDQSIDGESRPSPASSQSTHTPTQLPCYTEELSASTFRGDPTYGELLAGGSLPTQTGAQPGVFPNTNPPFLDTSMDFDGMTGMQPSPNPGQFSNFFSLVPLSFGEGAVSFPSNTSSSNVSAGGTNVADEWGEPMPWDLWPNFTNGELPQAFQPEQPR